MAVIDHQERNFGDNESNMLWHVLVILLILWFLGLFTNYTFSGGIHVLMFIAIIMLVARIVQEKKYYSDLIRCRRTRKIWKGV
ncbi:MAG: lmo0937 family membrane protein [Smithella sp.]|jgi:hypothetical protein